MQVVNIERNEVEYTLPAGSLTPYAQYQFRIRAQNVYGNGDFSAASPMVSWNLEILPKLIQSKLFISDCCLYWRNCLYN